MRAYLAPVFGVAFGGLILGEPLPTSFLIGLKLAPGGIVMVNR